jgi:hypothetical protein
MVFFTSKKQTVSYEKSIIAIAFLRNKSGTFPLNILQYKFQEDPINNCPNSSKSKFPMDACPKPATRVNGTA